MQTFKFQNEKCNDDRLEEWIETAVARGVQHLSVQIEEIEDIEEVDPPYVTQEIYRSNTLVSLYLIGVGIETPDCVVSLPRFKAMHIEDVQHDDDPLIVENIISGCPVLEVLAIIRTTESESLSAVKSLRVRSQTLRSFKILFENWFGGMHYAVEIDAPSLEYMSFRDDNSGVIVVKNLTSLYAIHIDTEFNLGFANYDGNPLGPKDSSKIKTIHDFLEGISGVRHMFISPSTIEILSQYSEFGSIPKFANLYRLNAEFSSSTIQLLPIFLESCPNLKELLLDYGGSKPIELSYVHRCLISTLEFVYINQHFPMDKTGIKLVNYFLENSAVLKELKLNFCGRTFTNKEQEICKNLLTPTKLSRRCQVSIKEPVIIQEHCRALKY
ncbi:unnamed protein product [Microthlaspi erraticum]|uniref:FBD domain-containing protein n=1 Tax=Microthlaspi erraticum TaxID=1685480 RepID=A0A6D2HKQ8_9BRAS|nr:unnamed protein product [Microthlaspi erraticum]